MILFKKIVLVCITLSLLILVSCSSKKAPDPFYLFDTHDSYFYHRSVTSDGFAAALECHYDKGIRFCNQIRGGNLRFYQDENYTYIYDFSSDKWNRSSISFHNSGGVDLHNKDNFEYAKSDYYDTYTLKSNLSAGQYLNYTITALKESGNIIIEYSLISDDVKVNYRETYSRFGEDFNLSLPDSYEVN